jgi:hypothetical protein
MHVFSVLFAEFKGVFGKAYLLAGLLPATLLYFGCSWFVVGGSLTIVFRDFFAESDLKSATLLAIGAQILFIAFALFAARTFLLKYVQTLRPGCARLRRYLIRRQLAHRARVQHDRVNLEVRYNSVLWLLGARQQVRPSQLPPGYVVPAPAYAVACSREALRACSRLAPHGFDLPAQPQREEVSIIVAGAVAMYACASQDHAALSGPLADWSTVLQRPLARALLQAVRDDIHRDLETVHSSEEGFPDPRWVGPTTLGTQSAVLDDYAKSRYGMHSSTMLTRLLIVLAPEERAALADSRLSVEVLVNLSVAMLLTSGFVALQHLKLFAATLFVGLDWSGRAFAFLSLPLGLAWIFYWAAVFAFDSFAEKVTRLIDTNRLALLEKLGFERPERVSEEQALWTELAKFFDYGGGLDGERKLRTK